MLVHVFGILSGLILENFVDRLHVTAGGGDASENSFQTAER
jgi:hypothetical protein